MTKLQYFKVTFFSVSMGLTTALFIWNLWQIEIYSSDNIGQAAIKSIFVGVITALVLAVLNMFFKVAPLKQKNSENNFGNN